MSPWKRTLRLGCVAGIVSTLVPAPATAQVSRIELHPFASTTLTDQEFLTGKREGKPVTLAGELRIPKPGTERLPAVVLLHGSGGVAGYVDEWAQRLNAMGVATFVVDSFTPRGIVTTFDDQSQLGRLASVVDAYRALALLAHHPRIDPARVGLMGFSRGGQAALYASLKRFQRMHAPADAAFALYLVFYPACVTRYLDDGDVAERPVRLFHGTEDDYNPIAACREYVERLQQAGKDVRLTALPGAGHVFDAPSLRPPVKLARAETLRSCRLEERAEGQLVNARTKQPFSLADPCVERGATLAFDAAAQAQSAREVAGLVATVLKR